MNRVWLCLWLLVLPMHSAEAQPPNACAEFYDELEGDRGASDVYVSVDKSTSDAACFLIPRSATTHYLRRHYRDGSDVIDMVSFDAVDLLSYLGDRRVVAVGSELREVQPEAIGCLADPSPTQISIHQAPRRTPPTAEMLATMSRATTSDVVGYSRYIENVDQTYQVELYVAEALNSFFWCGPMKGVSICTIIGAYDQMEIAITYRKADLPNVRPDTALACVRQIGALFRLR